MSAADQAKGPSAKAVGLATTLHAQRFDGSSAESFAEEIDEAAQPLAAALRDLLSQLEANRYTDLDGDINYSSSLRLANAIVEARDALREWGNK